MVLSILIACRSSVEIVIETEVCRGVVYEAIAGERVIPVLFAAEGSIEKF